MSFSSFLISIALIVLFFTLLGVYMLIRLLGGFGRLKMLYRTFSALRNEREQASAHKTKRSTSSSTRSTGKNKQSCNSCAQTKDKMFGEKEGTYVSFEEVE